MWEPSYKTMYLGLFASLSAELIHVIDEVWGYMDGLGCIYGEDDSYLYNVVYWRDPMPCLEYGSRKYLVKAENYLRKIKMKKKFIIVHRNYASMVKKKDRKNRTNYFLSNFFSKNSIQVTFLCHGSWTAMAWTKLSTEWLLFFMGGQNLCLQVVKYDLYDNLFQKWVPKTFKAIKLTRFLME